MLQWELYSMIQINTELEKTVRRGALTNENELDYAALIIGFLRVVPSPLSTWTNWGAGISAHSRWSEGASGKTESLKIYINMHQTHPCDNLWCTGLIHYISRLLVCSSEGFLHLYSLDQVPKACFSLIGWKTTFPDLTFSLTRPRVGIVLWFASSLLQKRWLTTNVKWSCYSWTVGSWPH